MKQLPFKMGAEEARVVLLAMQETCEHRGWNLLAAHIRSNHVHVVLQTTQGPVKTMNDLKAYASRALTRAGHGNPESRRWTRHGSTRYLWNVESVERAVHYVLHEQGEPMSVRVGEEMDLEAIFRRSEPRPPSEPRP